jgi:hypothetical protein
VLENQEEFAQLWSGSNRYRNVKVRGE